MKCKDDERRLLLAVQQGESLSDAAEALGVKPSRLAGILRKWRIAGIIDADTGELTAKGHAANGGAATVPRVDIEQDEDAYDDDVSGCQGPELGSGVERRED